jgi:repressor LexA
MLTLRQKEIFDFIVKFIDMKGVGPTLSEINDNFGLGSTSAAFQHGQTLQRKGFLKKLPFQARSIGLFEQTEDLFEIPLVGRIALGEPIESYQSPETIKVPKMLMSGSGQHYALQAKGDSMDEDGILEGDILIIKRVTDADNGDIVVAQVDGYKATLKRFYNHGDKVELRPKSKNSKYTPQFYSYGDIELQGKFCGLIRMGE